MTENQKIMEHEGDSDANFNKCAWKSLHRIVKESGKLRKSGRAETTQSVENTEKSSGD